MQGGFSSLWLAKHCQCRHGVNSLSEAQPVRGCLYDMLRAFEGVKSVIARGVYPVYHSPKHLYAFWQDKPDVPSDVHENQLLVIKPGDREMLAKVHIWTVNPRDSTL